MTNEEFDLLEVGSVILFGRRKRERIVRHVGLSNNGRSIYYRKKFTVGLVTKRCSWTNRPYTLYTRSDLKSLAEYTGKKVNLSQWEKGVFSYEWRNRNKPKLTCCDVKDYR